MTGGFSKESTCVLQVEKTMKKAEWTHLLHMEFWRFCWWSAGGGRVPASDGLLGHLGLRQEGGRETREPGLHAGTQWHADRTLCVCVQGRGGERGRDGRRE